MTQAVVKQDTYRQDFDRLEAETAGRVPAWLPPLRRAAFSRFAELGFPHRRMEEWRFTIVTPIAETPFRLAGTERQGVTLESLAEFTFEGLTGSRLVFVNGHYAPELSEVGALPSGVKVGSLASALREDGAALETHLARYANFENQAFTALNTAFLADGAFVSIPRNAIVEQPIHLLFVSTALDGPTVSHPRTLIVAGENSQATVIESYAGLGEGVTFANAVTEIVAGENAVLDHYKVQRERSEQAYHIATMQVQLGRSSNVSSHSIALGGALVRNEANAVLGGEGGECTLNGLYLANGRRLVDNHTAIDHAMPHCASHELYKGILDDRAHGVFNGKIFVRQDAQKTDAKQTNQTLLLSEDAQINTKPQLEIFADDVKCTHGATVGQLDADAIFYLRSRGIGLEAARSILTYAFASDIIHRIKVEPVKEQLGQALFANLPQGRQAEEALT
jgi:Fe-S cluster assembly protein SufD